MFSYLSDAESTEKASRKQDTRMSIHGSPLPRLLVQGLLASSLFLMAASLALAAAQSAQVQTGPITEPRGASHEPAGPPIAKGAAAITQQHEKCSTRLIVNADALFTPHRWTLNPDGGETLDVLGPLIAQAGKHPARIETYTAAADSDSENRDVAQRRAITVRSWLVNHQFLPEGTPVEGLSQPRLASKTGTRTWGTNRDQKNGTVDVVIDTCH